MQFKLNPLAPNGISPNDPSVVRVETGGGGGGNAQRLIDEALEYPASDVGVGYRPDNTLYDEWIAKYNAMLESPTPATPLTIFTIGDSCSSITNPTFTDHKPWPYLMDILGSQSEPINSYAQSGALGWLYAQGDSETRRMTSTQGTLTQNATGGWGSTLTVGQYATQVVFSNYIIVAWGRTSGGGDIEVRETSSSGTVLTTIDTDGTTKGGNLTQLELTANFFGRYLGTLYFVAAGASVVLEGVHLRASSSNTTLAVTINAAHSGYTTNSFTSTPTRAFDFAENNQPDLTIIMVGVNDGPTNIESRMRTLIEGLQAVNPDNLIVLVGMYVTAFSNTFTNAMSYIVKDLAEEYGCLFVDTNSTYPKFAQNKLYSGDLLHPSQNGHRAIASLLEGVLKGNPIGGSYTAGVAAGSYLPTVPAQWPYSSLSVQEALDYYAANIMWRAGTPESNLTANVGALARDTTNGVLYVKASGTGSTGWVKIPTISTTDTLTNKRVTPRVTTITSSATPTINTDNCDAVTITAQAGAITSMTTNLSGTPNNFDELIIRIKDNGTARAITWGSSFEAKGVALPTTTVISKVLTVAFIYDSVTSKWGCVGSAQEA